MAHGVAGPPVRPRRMRPRLRRQLVGAAGLFMVAVIIALVVMAYDQVFSPSVPVTVLAPRAGLLMDNGADVTMHGVTIGHVTSISPVGDSEARLGISLEPGQIHYIPANVVASIDAPSVFGPKYLDLENPAHPAAARLTAGTVIEPAQVSTEVDTVFANLAGVLNSVHPAKLAATLGAVSTALNGQGAQVGNFVVQLNSYLRQFNPSLPALGKDLAQAPSVAGAYSAAAPDLIKTLDNLRVTSGTLVSQQAQFDAFLLNSTGFANTTRGFLASNETGLTRTLSTLLPTTQLLDYYSPELSCLINGIEQINQLTVTNSINLNVAVVPGNREYSNPANLPQVKTTGAPTCYGGPLNKQTAAHWNGVSFDDGTNGVTAAGGGGVSLNASSLAQQLFGSSAAAASSAAAHKGH